MATVAIIIPNLNGKDVLKVCLDSLRKQTFKDFKVYVVDNGSQDNSARMIKENYSEARLIELKENTGFARASNIGIRKALEDDDISKAVVNDGVEYSGEKPLKYICPLNNDIELDERYLEFLVKSANRYQKKNVRLGILAAKLNFKMEPEKINTVGTLIFIDGSGMEKGFREKDEGQYIKREEIFGSCAAACLYNREMLEEIAYYNQEGELSFFDEDFFAYYEDLDMNYRSRLAGYRAFFIPRAFGYHVHSFTGQSFSPFKSFHVHRNQYYVLIKNFPIPYLILGLGFMPIRYVLLILSVLFKKGPASKLKDNSSKEDTVKIVLNSWSDVVKNCPSLLRKRKLIQKNKKVGLKEFGVWLYRYRASLKKMIFM